MKFLLMLLLLVSCATAKKKAIELSEKGQHEEAIQFWAEALKDDPEDEEIRNGFQASLDFVSNERLTKIRDKRLANNQAESLAEMKSLVELQKKYNIKLDFNSSSFQGKEINYLWPYYKSTIIAKLNKQLPLGAESDHKIYHDVFNSVSEYETVQQMINKKGKEKCGDLKSKQGSKPYFTSYVTQFCKYFKSEGSSKSSISSVLFLKSQVTANITNIADTSKGSIQTSIDKVLSETPWHHPEAKQEIKLVIKGDFQATPSSDKVRQAHSYIEKVPYTDYETVKKTRSVPYTDSLGTTKYKNETYKDQVPVTKYRDVPRVYEYWATKKALDSTINVRGTMYLHKEDFPFFFQKTTREEKLLQDINMPHIGLYPQREDVSDPLTKFDLLAKDVAEQFKVDINAIWEKKFCSLPGSRDLASVGENVTRCRRLAKYPEAFVDTWFMNNFGVTSLRAEELVGKF